MCMTRYRYMYNVCSSHKLLREAYREPIHGPQCVLYVDSNVHWSIKTILRNTCILQEPKWSSLNQILD